jgi:hypothetical protein
MYEDKEEFVIDLESVRIKSSRRYSNTRKRAKRTNLKVHLTEKTNSSPFKDFEINQQRGCFNA